MSTEVNPSARAARRAERARILAALADPTRLAIMDLLSVQDLSPAALTEALEIPGNLLAHHLKTLEAEGLIHRVHSKNDRRRVYVQAVEGYDSGLLPTAPELSAPRVLFVCTHNSARSVLAAALWREVSDVPSDSAGTHPAKRINPRARRAARRQGLTLAHETPQSIEDAIRPDDLVISVCDSVNEELPALDNARLHWSIPDPAAIDTDAAFDEAVAELRERIDDIAPQVRSTP